MANIVTISAVRGPMANAYANVNACSRDCCPHPSGTVDTDMCPTRDSQWIVKRSCASQYIGTSNLAEAGEDRYNTCLRHLPSQPVAAQAVAEQLPHRKLQGL